MAFLSKKYGIFILLHAGNSNSTGLFSMACRNNGHALADFHSSRA
jgi:hypothetical protein